MARNFSHGDHGRHGGGEKDRPTVDLEPVFDDPRRWSNDCYSVYSVPSVVKEPRCQSRKRWPGILATAITEGTEEERKTGRRWTSSPCLTIRDGGATTVTPCTPCPPWLKNRGASRARDGPEF